MRIEIPELSVVALIGASGSGKSTFASKHFLSTEILSSDYFRAMVSDNTFDQSATKAAFEALYFIANKRLDAGKLVVIDATNVQKPARESVINLAKEQNYLSIAIVFDIGEEVAQEHNKSRITGQVGSHVIKNQTIDLKRSIKNLQKEGFNQVYILKSKEEIAEVEIVRQPMWSNKSDIHGPFDIIGDIHGCFNELCELLDKLGYKRENDNAIPPEGRKMVFLGDLTDRGPKSAAVLRLVMNMVESGYAYCVPGNHDLKLQRFLKGSNVKIAHGLETTVDEIKSESREFKSQVEKFINSLTSHLIFDDGKLVVAHAGLKEKLQGRGSGKVRDFCLYGETSGEIDEYGLPMRHDWANEYRGKALVVYGHTPCVEPQSINNTICIDTGCVFGGKLTAFRYPERQIIDVKAHSVYYESARPLKTVEPNSDIISIEDVSGKRYINTRLISSILVNEENSIVALEAMSRFAADPHWLIYLPPTMSPSETSDMENFLEYPLEGFTYYKKNGVQNVVCEQKHMGSRAVIIACKNKETAQKRFGITDGSEGIIYTRTGRHFFDDDKTEKEIIKRLQKVLDDTNFWLDFDTEWICLDTELMPWSAKALGLIEEQYSAVGRSGRESLSAATAALKAALNNKLFTENISEASGQTVNLNNILEDYEQRQQALKLYTEAYRNYCWNVDSIDDYRIAPFHILATEHETYNEKNHIWHLEMIDKYIANPNSIFMSTNHIIVDLTDEQSIKGGIDWWQSLTENGGEGMVIKPYTFITRNDKNEVLQPAIKCRGKEYLRIIYGPEYTLKGNLNRLKKRSVSKKRQLALKEFALGMESLERFIKKEPLYKVHECVFAILAMESEPVDPRL